MRAARHLFLVSLLLAASACAPVERTTAERIRDLEGRVWSPYCPGRLLVECSTRQARELRDRIAERVRDGESDEEVMAWVRSNFGDEALAAPPPGARGLAIWVLPIAAVAGGALVVARVIRRWSRQAPEGAPIEEG